MRILSLDGGGVRSTATAMVLENLEAWLRHRDSSIYQEFDMFAGTSSGALLVADMVYGDMTAAGISRECNDIRFSLMMPPNSLERALGSLQLRPLYDGIGKRAMLSRHVKATTRLCDTQKHVLMTGFDIDSRRPINFCSWKPNSHILVRDVLDISTATPGYFPIATTTSSGDRIRGVDGMLVGTNPTDIAYTYALSLVGKDADIRVLSIGSGCSGYNRATMHDQAGGLQWFNQGELMETLFDAPQHITEFKMEGLTKALGHKYIRVNGVIPNSRLDDTKALNVSCLKERGNTWWRQHKHEICREIFDYNSEDEEEDDDGDEDEDDDSDYEEEEEGTEE